MFFLGMFCGAILAIVGLWLYASWAMPRVEKEVKEEIDIQMRESMESHFDDGKFQDMARAEMEKHKSLIEFEAIERLKHAMDQAERTGQPVKVELAGVEEYIYVSPPPGLEKKDRN